MYSSGPALFAFTWAEIPFILLAAMVFVVPFYFLCGLALDAGKFWFYYLFIVLDIGLFTFNGQMMMSIFRDSVTAQGFSGLVLGLTSLFSGVLIRPNNIPTFWVFGAYFRPQSYCVIRCWCSNLLHVDCQQHIGCFLVTTFSVSSHDQFYIFVALVYWLNLTLLMIPGIRGTAHYPVQ